jgi:hypothetical protein
MNTFKQKRDYIVIDNEKYWHFSSGGKHKSTEWMVIDDIHYYKIDNTITYNN